MYTQVIKIIIKFNKETVKPEQDIISKVAEEIQLILCQ
jgi:hypothetical protein